MKLSYRIALVVLCGIYANGLWAQSCTGDTLKEKIENCTEGVTVESDPIKFGSWEKYTLTIVQPVDHANPDSPTFKQRLVLLHRNQDGPMVLATTGYYLYNVAPKEITYLLEANQLLVEHRYFSDSMPSDPDWRFMNIKQSADDFHRVTQQFKKLYPGKWVNTGHSKGGMTSVYHRRFYPDDLDATVAYVAPLSFSTADERYVEFIDNVGGETLKECREKLDALATEVLSRKSSMISLFPQKSFTRFGGPIQALEVIVSDFAFVFFQYDSPSSCQSLPAIEDSDEVLYRGFDKIARVQDYSDSGIAPFEPYFYQAATELGAPAPRIELFGELIEFPSAFDFDKFTPPGVDLEYDPKAMSDIDAWVQNESSEIMFIYGEYDPWTAGAFRLGTSVDRDSHLLMAPEGNHGARISRLTAEDREVAHSILGRWMETEIDASAPTGPRSDPFMEQRRGLRP